MTLLDPQTPVQRTAPSRETRCGTVARADARLASAPPRSPSTPPATPRTDEPAAPPAAEPSLGLLCALTCALHAEALARDAVGSDRLDLSETVSTGLDDRLAAQGLDGVLGELVRREDPQHVALALTSALDAHAHTPSRPPTKPSPIAVAQAIASTVCSSARAAAQTDDPGSHLERTIDNLVASRPELSEHCDSLEVVAVRIALCDLVTNALTGRSGRPVHLNAAEVVVSVAHLVERDELVRFFLRAVEVLCELQRFDLRGRWTA